LSWDLLPRELAGLAIFCVLLYVYDKDFDPAPELCATFLDGSLIRR
jgi:hypothetical protein